MRVLRTEKRSKKSILKDFSPEYSLKKELMQKLKLQYFGHLIRSADSLEMPLMLGRIEGRRKRVQQRMRWLDGITYLMARSLSKLWGLVMDEQVGCSSPWGGRESDTTK